MTLSECCLVIAAAVVGDHHYYHYQQQQQQQTVLSDIYALSFAFFLEMPLRSKHLGACNFVSYALTSHQERCLSQIPTCVFQLSWGWSIRIPLDLVFACLCWGFRLTPLGLG